MEGCEKIQCLIPPSLLNLAHWGFPKDLRRWFWKNYLDELDQAMVWGAHKGIQLFPTYGRGREFMEEACKNGYLNLFIWMRKGCEYPNWEWRFHETAALYGHLNILKWMHEVGTCNPGLNTFVLAAKGRHFNILEWSIQNRPDWTRDYILPWLSYEPEILDWINKHMQ